MEIIIKEKDIFYTMIVMFIIMIICFYAGWDLHNKLLFDKGYKIGLSHKNWDSYSEGINDCMNWTNRDSMFSKFNEYNNEP